MNAKPWQLRAAVWACGAAASLGGVGCSTFGVGYDEQCAACAYEGVPPSDGRNRVHVFVIDGYLPVESRRTAEVRQWLIRNGYAKVYSGTAFHEGTFAATAAKVKAANPDARIVVVGIEGGGKAAVALSKRLKAADHAPDAVVFFDPAGVTEPAAGPALVIRTKPGDDAGLPPDARMVDFSRKGEEMATLLALWTKPFAAVLDPIAAGARTARPDDTAVAFDPAPTPAKSTHTTLKPADRDDPLKPVERLPAMDVPVPGR